MDIRLKTMHLENFKCHKSLTLELEGRNASIYGDNATGKTSVYDALTWLLFGKDSAGNGEKNIEIKPLNPDGSIRDHQAITEVEAVLLVDGGEIALKRTYQEVWSTKRGSSEASYDGNTSEYYVNGVPCKANAYKAQVAALVDEERFRLLTSVSYFPMVLAWQKRRETLFSLFGALDDRQIMATDGRFGPLAEAMGGYTLEDFKKVISQKRKGLSATRNEVPARISECEKTISDLAALDFDGAEAQLGILRSRLDSLNTEMLAIQQNTAVQQKELALQKAQMELAALEQENRRYRDGQKAAAPTAAALEDDMNRRDSLRNSLQHALALRLRDIQRCDEAIENARNQWKHKNAEQYTGGDECPTCGQKLPADTIAKAMEAFTARKQAELAELVQRSEQIKAEKAENEKKAEETRGFIQAEDSRIQELAEKIAAAKAAAATMVIQDKEGYGEEKARIQADIGTLSGELRKLREDAATAAAGLRNRIGEIQAEIARVTDIAGKRSAYEYAVKRIAQLREDAKAAADNLNEIDKLLFLTEEFSRYKASFVESGINGRFRLARFRLYREQANGGTEDRCDVTYDGVPYIGLNNGMKINVGIDIINTLSRAYGVTVPLFVDNAESVTKLEKTGCQVVRLVVSENDKELRINHEN
ncbi:MAG: AAA family ATPase [Candidatus Faecousia sp.]|nr:AAA family ATPase [Candidatus Faecousia sp.]